jgi:hypothetical protein
MEETMKRTVKVQFMDYWADFQQKREQYLLLKLLRKHYDVQICNDPDYVFYSVMGETHWGVPDKCIKICHTGENLVPDFNACDYAIGFEWMDYGDRYIRFPLYLFYQETLLQAMLHKHEIGPDWNLDEEKSGFCSFVVSNADNPVRNEAFRQLSAYRKVDSGGHFLNNVGGAVEDKLAFERSHKFSLCFENGSHPGYTTEKLVEAFAARTVPIYWGDPEVGKVFNTGSFIQVKDGASFSEAIRLVKELDQDDELYIRMLREPAMRPDAPSLEEEYARLEAWLLSIFEQSLEEAGRRNRSNRGRIYLESRLALDRRHHWKQLCGLWLRRFRRGLGKLFGQCWES